MLRTRLRIFCMLLLLLGWSRRSFQSFHYTILIIFLTHLGGITRLTIANRLATRTVEILEIDSIYFFKRGSRYLIVNTSVVKVLSVSFHSVPLSKAFSESLHSVLLVHIYNLHIKILFLFLF